MGKIGDVLSILPLLQHYASRDRSPVNLVVSKQYSDVVAGLWYINPIIYDGHWQDLRGAIKFAKAKFDTVVVPQTYGRDVTIEHRFPSFQYDQWWRAGGLALWNRLPLTVNRKGHDEIAEHHMGERPTILFADRGESSQFENSDRLAEKLRGAFPDHQLLLLSSIRLEHFTDFVALYDKAKAVIVTETAHLHLAKATTTPVFALVTDKPERWHGSAWSKKHLLHIRYSQYERREMELIEGIRSVINTELIDSRPL